MNTVANISIRSIILPLIVVSFMISCATQQKKTPDKPATDENALFLKAVPESREEIFRVVLQSDRYEVAQMSNVETIVRSPDKSGDQYISEELAKYDKINEVREAILSIWLYPDTGRIMKVRPKRLAALREIDELLVDDVQRWEFTSPRKREIYPTKFDIHFRIVLRKKQSDEEIIKEVREKMKEKAGQ
jgi:signal recognition particle subunit SEC65